MKKKSILIVIIILLLAGGGVYYFFFYGKQDSSVSSSAGESVNPAEIQASFVSTLLQLRSLTMDTKVLKSAVFNSLVPSGATIDLNPDRGRPDPFFAVNPPLPNAQDQSNVNDLLPRDFTGASVTTSNASIKVSNVTSSTATIAIIGVDSNTAVSVDLSKTGGAVQNITGFNYKADKTQYTRVITGLSSKTSYTVSIHDPSQFKDAQASFNTN